MQRITGSFAMLASNYTSFDLESRLGSFQSSTRAEAPNWLTGVRSAGARVQAQAAAAAGPPKEVKAVPSRGKRFRSGLWHFRRCFGLQSGKAVYSVFHNRSIYYQLTHVASPTPSLFLSLLFAASL